MNETERATLAYLTNLCHQRYYGSVCLQFEAGRIVHVRREENIKPLELLKVTNLLCTKGVDIHGHHRP
jgi:hypothetical protein